jgi:DNA topoisomerase-1
VLRRFWEDFSHAVDGTKDLKISDVLKSLDEDLGRHFFPDDGSGRDPRRCPVCDGGKLSLKLGRFGAFIGCSNYPNCRYTRALGIEPESDGKPVPAPDTELGHDPASGLAVTLKKGPYGHYIQLGAAATDGSKAADKPKRVALPRGLAPSDINIDIAIKLLALPREIGRDPDSGEPISAGIGRFGPYIKRGTQFVSLGGDDDVLNIGLNRAVTLLAEAKTGGRRGPQLLRELGQHPEGGTVGLYRGRYGPYVGHDGLIASLPRGADPDQFTLAEALPLLAAQKAKGKPPRKPRAASSAGPAPAAAAANGAARRAAAKPAAKKASARGKAAGKAASAKAAKPRRAASRRPATP